MKTNLAESGESEESDGLEDGDDEALPSKSELEWMILKYLQPIHRYPSMLLDLTVGLLRQLADLHARLVTVEEKLGGGEGSGREQE